MISKLLIIFLHPLTWVVALLLLGLFKKDARLKKQVFIAALCLLYLFSNRFLVNQFSKLWDIREFASDSKVYSCVIVLGGFASESTATEGFFNSAADRFIQGTKLVLQKKASTILISGGNGSLVRTTFVEADYVKGQLRYFNIPDSSILVENKSKNTLENAAFTKILLKEKNLKPPYLLVTSAFHMRRSLYTFKQAGLDVAPYSCDFKAGMSDTVFDDFLPHADAMAVWDTYIKEVVGYVVYYLKTR